MNNDFLGFEHSDKLKDLLIELVAFGCFIGADL